MNKLQIFKNAEFGEIRIIEQSGEPWFVGKDVATALGYKDTVNAIKSHVDDDDKAGWQITTQFGVKEAIIVNESGLYSLILSSKLPTARKFKHWVTAEVLPAIRRTGSYATALPQTFAQALRLAAEQQEQLEAQQRQLEANRPKVAFADAITSSSTSCLIGELAKLIRQAVERQGRRINIGQNRFFQWLRDNGFLGRSAGYYNIANQAYIEQGLFELKHTVHDENGTLVTKTTTKVTGRGQSYFINGFLDGRFIIQ